LSYTGGGKFQSNRDILAENKKIPKIYNQLIHQKLNY